MSEMLPEMFGALGQDAAEAIEEAGEADARFIEQTAENEDAAVQRLIDTDRQIAQRATAIGDQAERDAVPEGGPDDAVSEVSGGDRGGGFDPAFEKGPLDAAFSPGIADPSGEFSDQERAIADRLAQEGWRVDAREPDHTAEGIKNPDAMVRKSPDDPGSVTEFKTLNKPSNNALKRDINDASRQAGADGEVVIDGRPAGTTVGEAERAYRRALGQPGKIVANRVHIILGDGNIITFEKEQP
jgi:hypothetical protein